MITYNSLMCVAATVLMYVIIKYFTKWKVNNLHGLFFNYLTAACFSFLLNYNNNIQLIGDIKNFYHVSLAIGLLFIIVFFLTIKTAQEISISTASVAAKMSMVIPLIAGVFLYEEVFTPQKIIGLLLALASVYLTSLNPTNETQHTKRKFIILLPFLLFLGAGIVDTSVKFAQQNFINEQNQYLFVSTLFGSAALFGFFIICKQLLFKESVIEKQSVLAGILLGIINFFSLYFLLQALAEPGMDSGKLFTSVNILIVLTSVPVAYLFFRERPHKAGYIGIILAVIAIYVML
jgi:drug/metabolite transporter (DMT)-like permease